MMAEDTPSESLFYDFKLDDYVAENHLLRLIVWLDKDTVMMTYNATQAGTCGGKEIPGKVIESSLWQKKSGRWVSPCHQETPMPGM